MSSLLTLCSFVCFPDRNDDECYVLYVCEKTEQHLNSLCSRSNIATNVEAIRFRSHQSALGQKEQSATPVIDVLI